MYVFIARLLPRRAMRYAYRWTQPCCLVCGYRNSDCVCEQSDRMTTDLFMASDACRNAPPSLIADGISVRSAMSMETHQFATAARRRNG
jgi:hypothetical protein